MPLNVRENCHLIGVLGAALFFAACNSQEAETAQNIAAKAPTASQQTTPAAPAEPRYWYGTVIHPDGRIAPLRPGPLSFGEGVDEADGAPPEALEDTVWPVAWQDAGNGNGMQGEPEDEPSPEEEPDEDNNEETPPVFYGEEITGTQCVVTRVMTRQGPNVTVHDPLRWPPYVTPPRPGANERQNTGTIEGQVPPGMVQGHTYHAVGTGFEFHADLNNIHGCFSRQQSRHFQALINKTNGEVSRGQGRGFGPTAGWDADGYDYTTHTGIVNFNNGVIGEGTTERIHWIDAPSKVVELNADPRRRSYAEIRIDLLRSTVWNADGIHGRFCLTGITFVRNLVDNRLTAVNELRAAFAQATPEGGDQGTPTDKAIARALRTPVAQGGWDGKNPSFRDLGCYTF